MISISKGGNDAVSAFIDLFCIHLEKKGMNYIFAKKEISL